MIKAIAEFPKIILGNITGNDDDQTIQMVEKGIDILNIIISSPEFKNEFLTFPFVQTNGKSNQQLWDLFVDSSPITINIDIRDMGFRADYIFHTIGKDNVDNSNNIYMNSHFVKTSYMVGDNALHEVWHILGLSHHRSKDYTSVPYGNNTLYEKIAKIKGIEKGI